MQLFKKSKKPTKITILGTENSGKTSIFNFLNTGIVNNLTPPEPTISYNHTKLVRQSITNSLKSQPSKKAKKLPSKKPKIYDIWDVSSNQISIDYFWKNYIHKSEVLVFVVDGAELAQNLSQNYVTHLTKLIQLIVTLSSQTKTGHLPPILFLINKSDKPNSCSSQQFFQKYKISELCQKRFIGIQSCSTKTGHGLKNLLYKLDKMMHESRNFKSDIQHQNYAQQVKSDQSQSSSKSKLRNIVGLDNPLYSHEMACGNDTRGPVNRQSLKPASSQKKTIFREKSTSKILNSIQEEVEPTEISTNFNISQISSDRLSLDSGCDSKMTESNASLEYEKAVSQNFYNIKKLHYLNKIPHTCS